MNHVCSEEGCQHPEHGIPPQAFNVNIRLEGASNDDLESLHQECEWEMDKRGILQTGLVKRVRECEAEIHALKAEQEMLRRRIGRALDIATDEPPASVRDVVRVLEGRSGR